MESRLLDFQGSMSKLEGKTRISGESMQKSGRIPEIPNGKID